MEAGALMLALVVGLADPQPAISKAGELQPGARVLIYTRRERLVGVLESWDDKILALRQDPRSVAIPRQQVRSIYVSHGKRPRVGRGAMTGLVFGAVLGGAFLLGAPGDDEVFTGSGVAAAGALGGAVVGAIIGGVIGGVPREDWRKVSVPRANPPIMPVTRGVGLKLTLSF